MQKTATEQAAATWAKAEPQDVARRAVDTVRRLETNQGFRRQKHRAWLAAALGRPVNELSASCYTRGAVINRGESNEFHFEGFGEPISVRVAESVIDTAVAKIAAKQRPKPVLLTSGGDYATRLRAKRLSKFLLAQMHLNQGCYENAWELGEQLFRDCCMWEAGIAKVRADASQARVVLERCFVYDLFVDDQEARDGMPRNLFHQYGYDRATLAERFPKLRQQIMTARPYSPRGESIAFNDSDMIGVFEAWRLPYSNNKPGRHVIAIEGGEYGATSLVDEPWSHDRFPFGFIRWKRNQFGIWGTPMVEQIVEPQLEMQRTYAAIQRQMRVLAKCYVDAEKGSYKDDDIQSDDELRIMEREPGTSPVRFVLPTPFHPGTMDWAMHWRSMAYELPGVNEMGSMGRKEPGVDSGVAIRSMNDLQGERFLPNSRAYEQLFTQFGELILMAMQDLEAEMKGKQKGEGVGKGSSISASFPSDGFLEEIDWEKSKLEPSMYRVTIESASSFPDTLAGRLQLLQDATMSGWINSDAAKRLALQGDSDIEALEKRENSQHRYVERVITRFQEADDEDEAAQLYHENQPDPFLSLPLAMGQMAEAYFEARCDDAPEFVLNLFRDWILKADQMLQSAQQPAAPAAPPAGMPPGEPGPGAPMGQPMPTEMAGAPPMAPVAA